MNAFQVCLLSLAIVFCGFTGCGEDRELPTRTMVSGNVTLDGKPLEKGAISFASPEDVASGMAAATDIKDGRYELQVTPGNKTVKVNCFVKGSSSDEINTEYAELIPEKYNTMTTLEANVGTETEFDFTLTSD